MVILKAIIKRILGKKITEVVSSILNRIREVTLNDVLRPFQVFFNPIKVSFIVVGAQKSGTTALYHFLSQHPELSLSRVKETNYFSTDIFWKNNVNYDLYHKYFKTHFKKIKYGEASPNYMLNHDIVAPRVAKYNPNIKLIFILKNPVERAFSQYKMHVKKHNLNLSFAECLQIGINPNQTDIVLDKNNQVTLNGSTRLLESYIGFGKYVEQIRTFKKFFEPNQMLFLLNEDLLNHHEETMKVIYNFLNVSCLNIEKEIIHTNNISNLMTEDEKKILLSVFSDEIYELQKILKRDLTHWNAI